MIITCEQCNTTFSLDEALLKPTGSRVQCSKCKKIFSVYPAAKSEESKESAAAVSELERSETDAKLQTSQKDRFEDKSGLSDLKDSMETKEEPLRQGESEKGPDESGLDFDFDLSVDDEEIGEDRGDFDFDIDLDETTDEEVEELDLSELEEMLEVEEPETTSQAEEEIGPDTDIVVDSQDEPEDKVEEFDIEPDMEISTKDDVEISDIEAPAEPDSLQEIESEIAPASDELEFETATDDQEDLFEKKPSEKKAPVEAMSGAGISTTDTESSEDQKYQEPDRELDEKDVFQEETIKPVRKKGVSSPLLVILILTILGGGAYGAWIFLDKPQITIPYINDFLKPKTQDLGNLKITPININSNFVNNSKSGKLFVITGRGKNSYPDTRKFIKVVGKLYSKGKKLVKKETIYAGNILSKKDLSNLELNLIKKRLTDKTVGTVAPGKALPFMIVFNNLPNDLDEFTVEVKESSPLK